MYKASTLIAGLQGLIGWRQNLDSSGVQLQSLTTSSSGLWFNEAHPLLTIDNLVSLAPPYDRLYSTSSEINTAYTDWLKDKTDAFLLRTVEDWFSRKTELQTAKNLLGQTELFKTTGNVTNLETSSGRVVGMEILPCRSKSLKVTIEKVSIQLDTNQSLTVRLFKSGQVTEVSSVSITYTGNGSVQWETVNWELSGEGAYYVVYDQDDLSGNAINGVKDHNYVNAGTTHFPTGRYFGARAFHADIADASALWDLTSNEYTVSTNYGLNLSLYVGCDYTDFILQQKEKFKTAFMLRVAMGVLRLMAFNPDANINRHESNIKFNRPDILNELEGTPGDYKKLNLSAQYEKAINDIQFDTSMIDKICLTCRKRSIQMTTIGSSRGVPFRSPWDYS